MKLVISPKPLAFFQLWEEGKAVWVLLPTFVDVVFYDETAKAVNWCEQGVPPGSIVQLEL